MSRKSKSAEHSAPMRKTRRTGARPKATRGAARDRSDRPAAVGDERRRPRARRGALLREPRSPEPLVPEVRAAARLREPRARVPPGTAPPCRVLPVVARKPTGDGDHEHVRAARRSGRRRAAVDAPGERLGGRTLPGQAVPTRRRPSRRSVQERLGKGAHDDGDTHLRCPLSGSPTTRRLRPQPVLGGAAAGLDPIHELEPVTRLRGSASMPLIDDEPPAVASLHLGLALQRLHRRPPGGDGPA